MRDKSKTGWELVGSLIGSIIVVLFAAWALMRGLNDIGVTAGYGSCLLICVAAQCVIGNGSRS
jgi:flagellar biogenesis protein FliO